MLFEFAPFFFRSRRDSLHPQSYKLKTAPVPESVC